MIEVFTQVVVRDPTVLSGTLPSRVRLATNVIAVKTGTPLAPTPEGWVAAPVGKLVAGASGFGGELVPTYRGTILQIYTQRLNAGSSYIVSDLDAHGGMTFVESPEGPYLALTERQIIIEGR